MAAGGVPQPFPGQVQQGLGANQPAQGNGAQTSAQDDFLQDLLTKCRPILNTGVDDICAGMVLYIPEIFGHCRPRELRQLRVALQMRCKQNTSRCLKTYCPYACSLPLWLHGSRPCSPPPRMHRPSLPQGLYHRGPEKNKKMRDMFKSLWTGHGGHARWDDAGFSLYPDTWQSCFSLLI